MTKALDGSAPTSEVVTAALALEPVAAQHFDVAFTATTQPCPLIDDQRGFARPAAVLSETPKCDRGAVEITEVLGGRAGINPSATPISSIFQICSLVAFSQDGRIYCLG